MWPTFSQVNEKAIKPLDEGKITQQEAIKEAEGPFREFMYGQTQTKDIKLFVDISGDEYETMMMYLLQRLFRPLYLVSLEQPLY